MNACLLAPATTALLSFMYDDPLVTFHTSSRLELNHSIRALLVQNTVSALFAPNGVALLQDDLGIAVTAEVVDGFRGIFEGAAACDVEAALRGVGAGVGGVLLAAEGGRGVLFARHGAVRRRGVW